MIVVLYSKDGGLTQKIATAYIGLTLAQVMAQGWGNNANVCGYYEVPDQEKIAGAGGVGWRCGLSADEVIAQGVKLD